MNPHQPHSDIILRDPSSSCVMFNSFHCVNYPCKIRNNVTTRNYGKSTQEHHLKNTTYNGCETYV